MAKILDFWRSEISSVPGRDPEAFLATSSDARAIEIPWSVDRFEHIRPRTLLDCGSSHIDRNYFGLYWNRILSKCDSQGIDIAALRGDRYRDSVSIEDLRRFKVRVADLRATGFDADFFDMILCISTIEHVGFEVGVTPTTEKPYSIDRNVPYEADTRKHREDFRAIGELMRILKPGGTLILTVPFGLTERYIQVVDSLGFIATEICYDETRIQSLVKESKGTLLALDRYFERADGGWEYAEGELPRSSKQAVACLSIEKRRPAE